MTVRHHWTVEDRKQRQKGAEATLPMQGTMLMQVLGSDGNSERIVAESSVGRRITPYAYPFASSSAWIRGQPEVGTIMLSMIGADTRELQPIAYFDATKPSQAETYDSVRNQILNNPDKPPASNIGYRHMLPGELDLGSKAAQLFMGSGQQFAARGGLSHFTMTNDRTVLETAEYKVHGPHHEKSTALNDEMRFGVVRRATPLANATNPSLIRDLTAIPYVDLSGVSVFPFGKELTQVLNWKGVPGTLLDHRQGVVVDDNGTFPLHKITNRKLRGRWLWGSLLLEQTRVELDEGGNWYMSLPFEALDGVDIRIPAGNWRMEMGQNLTSKTLRDTKFSALGRFDADALLGFGITTPFTGLMSANAGITMKTLGVATVDTLLPLTIRLGANAVYPIMVANPTYISSLGAYYAAEGGFTGTAAAYGGIGAAAWTALGVIAAALDPSGTTAALMASAAAASAAWATAATAMGPAIGAHVATLTPMPAGAISMKTMSE